MYYVLHLSMCNGWSLLLQYAFMLYISASGADLILFTHTLYSFLQHKHRNWILI